MREVIKLYLIRKYGRLVIRQRIFWQSSDVPLFGNEIEMVSVNTKIKLFHKLLNVMLYIYIYIFMHQKHEI